MEITGILRSPSEAWNHKFNLIGVSLTKPAAGLSPARRGEGRGAAVTLVLPAVRARVERRKAVMRCHRPFLPNSGGWRAQLDHGWLRLNELAPSEGQGDLLI